MKAYRTKILYTILCVFAVLLSMVLPMRAGESESVIWKRLTQQNKSLPDNAITAVISASDNSLWIGSLSGLRRYANGSVTSFKSNVEMPPRMEVNCLLETSDGSVWIGTESQGLIVARQDQLTFLGFQSDLGAVVSLVEYDNSIIVIYPNAVSRYNLSSQQWDKNIFRLSAGITSKISMVHLSSTSGLLWIGTVDGQIRAVSASTLSEQTPRNGVDGGETALLGAVNQIFEAKDRTIWVSTQGAGIWRFAGRQWERFTEANTGLQDAAATKIVEDEQGNIWISTRDGGVGRYSPDSHRWDTYGTWNNKLGSNRITDIVVRGREVWVSTDGGGISRFFKGEWDSYTQESTALGENTIRALLPLKNGELAALGQGGTVSYFSAATGWRISRAEASVPLLLYQSADGSVWLATFTGLFRETFGEWRQMNASPVTSLKIRQIFETRDGAIAFSTLADGLLLYYPPSAKFRLPLTLDQGRRLIKFHIEAQKSSQNAWTLYYGLATGERQQYNSQRFDDKGDAVVAVPADQTERIQIKYYAVGPYGELVENPGVDRPTELDFTVPFVDRITDIFKRIGPFIPPMHIAVWSILFIFYPYSPTIQSMFFWNPRVRKIGGLWYVDLLLSAPILRSRLLAPFRSSLTSDVDPLPAGSYFQNQTVCEFVDGEIREPFAISKVADLIHGHIIIRGKSGSGKTHFLRYLISKKSRLSVFVPASACDAGVVEAILSYLPAHINDAFLVEKLVYHGALCVYIDGLNEASVEARQSVVSCFRKFPHSTIVVTTQPLAWHPPSTARSYDMQPLDSAQIAEYLRFKGQSGPIYEEHCSRFLFAHIDDPKLTQSDVLRNLETLSVPFDLDLAASLIRRGLQPTLYSLQQQFVELIAADYEEKYGDRFPFSTLYELAYSSKLSDSKQVESDKLKPDLLAYLVHKRILLIRNGMQPIYRFRHDRIQDYLILRYLDQHQGKQLNHLDDVRFLGVYLLLADEMPEDAARILLERLSIVAAKTKEHSISDAFVMKLFSRNLIGGERAKTSGTETDPIRSTAL